MSRSLWPRWARLSQVERVEAYTRQSLLVLLYGTPVFLLLSGSDRIADGGGALAVVLGASLVVTLVAARALRAVMDLYPAAAPVPWRPVGALLAVAVVSTGACIALPEGPGRVLGLTTWGVTVIALVGLTDRRIAAAVVVGATLVPTVLTGRAWVALVALGTTLFFVFTVRASLWLLGVVVEVDRSRTAQGELAVAEERLRFSRDVHDVLGRHLSAIAVQAELAATLAERGDERAAARMLEVREHAHDALREARELARGYRDTSLERELDGARSLLQAAGIATSVDTTGLDPAWHEAAGWVVRESVTNVLRHSRATLVTIRWTDDGVVEVRNDGVTAPPGSRGSDGRGLVGLRERLAALGATLHAERDGSEFVVRVDLPTGGAA
ncbi:histidine kinase [Nocardioides flavescens]|uniref:Sensor histidine kinase n=1 Tax=Nocardioides flavescens TaxID=2691959 RepID=A0A6L7END4_9ACTN|nr:sensor histidine kinase [Nocardioides flavescens]